MNGAALIAEILKREGVEILFAYPRNELIEGAAAVDIRTIFTRQERTAVHMADAMSRMTRGKKMGVFCMQQGPGTENAYGSVAQAYSESVPVLVIPRGFNRRLAHVPRNFNATIVMAHVAKHAEPLTSGSDVEHVFRRAFTQLRNGRGGPVVIEVPGDVFAEDVPGPIGYTPVVSTRYGPEASAVAEAAKTLVQAQRPVIYAGQGVHWAEAYDELRELADLLAAPVCTSLPGKSSFDETHPLSLGSGGVSMRKSLWDCLHASDVIFGIGCSFSATPFGVALPPGKTVIHATLDPADINKNVPVTHALIGDAKLTLQALVAECRKGVGSARDIAPVAARIKDIETAWMSQWLPKLTSEEVPLGIFGLQASDAVAGLLRERGIEVRTSTLPVAFEHGSLAVTPSGAIDADRVVALPLLRGRAPAGLPADPDGFLPTDEHGRVRGCEHVYAAGDATAFPVKQGGIATQQADAAARTIAAQAGAPVELEPFRPVLRGLLLTGDGARFMRSEIAGGQGDSSDVSTRMLWWPETKVAGQYLSHYLSRSLSPVHPVEPLPPDAIPVELDLRHAQSAT